MPTTYETSQGDERNTTRPPSDQVQDLQEDAQALLDSAREQGSAKLDEYRETAADQIETLAQTAKSAAEQMQDNDTLGLSHYVTDVAQGMTSFASSLRNKSAEQLLQQAGQLAKDNPALFITGSIALGFGLSRFLRASTSDLSASASASSPSRDNGQHDDASHQQQPGDAASPVFDEPVTTSSGADVYRGGQPATVDPLAPQAGAVSPAHGSVDEGITRSGAELGSFESSDNYAASPGTSGHPESVSPPRPTLKNEGEL